MNSPILTTNENEWKITYDGKDDAQDQVSDGRRMLARTLSVPKMMCILSDKKTEISTVTELTSPKMKLPQLGSDTVERVFPVRSVVSFDSTVSPALQTPSLDKLESPFPQFPFGDTVQTNESADGSAGGFPTSLTRDTSDLGPKRPNYLARMHHQLSLSNISPSLSRLPGENRESNSTDQAASSPTTQLESTIRECGEVLTRNELKPGLGYPEDENSVAVQPFGALLILSELDDNIIVQAASTNSNEILGYSPDELFEYDSIFKIFPDSQQEMFFSHIKYVSSDEYDMETCGPEVFPLCISVDEGVLICLWCTMHTSKVSKNYIICELEPHSADIQDRMDVTRSREIPTALRTGHNVVRSKSYAPGEHHCIESELLNTLPRIIQQISNAQTLEALVQHSMASVKRLIRFHRMSMYHFDSERNGIVVADSVSSSMGISSFEGLEFPEQAFSADLKKQYLRNKVSFAYRKSEGCAELAYRASTVKTVLDLSHCYLLVAPGFSQAHTVAPVQACISIGIYVFGKLWGLISCQSYAKSTRLHPLIQRTCWLLSETFSSNIERLSYTLPFEPKQPNGSVGGVDNKHHVQTPPGDLLDIFGADYAAASILGETRILGRPADSQEALALLEYLRAKELDTVLWSTDILSDFEDLDYSPGFRLISSLIYIPLSADGQDFITLFRGETEGGKGQAEWSASELGKASILSLLYRTFTEIWQEKEATMQDHQLMRLLLANSAHEFRTPLNAIINYLEIALDGNINQETRDNLSRSHSASKSLVYIINDLLDLTNAENGQNLIKDEIFSLSETLCEATNIFWEEARQKHVNLQVVQHAAFPAVLGDQRRVRQVITNLISNAVQHTSTGAVTIESCMLTESWDEGHIAIEVAIHDTGSGMSQEAVETLFCELEQVSNKEYTQSPKAYARDLNMSTSETESVLGLGLALVARIVRNMNGQLSLKSEEGKGSCFKIRLKFSLPSEDNEASHPATQSTTNSNHQSATQYIPNADPQSNRQGCDRPNPKEIPSIGNVDNPLVDADISLNGESRNLTILPSGAKVEDKVPLRSGSGQMPQHSVMDFTPTSTTSLTGPANTGNGFNFRTGSTLRILIAEDDPINSSIVKKRLEKFGYSICMTGNGKECASVHRESPISFDVILMDLQMPIVDGLSATKMIREYEQQSANHRTPVFAVSASLIEKDRQVYLDAGFDGWIMKPIDFQRVNVLLSGVLSAERRDDALYQPGMWELGGWFGR
ncbi:Sensor histidine kinase/response regulator [Penicillium sp. IBT 16267x]|nr:Sensor histidine kinase/response regulator [Penicillium sp. IBT 16267x]